MRSIKFNMFIKINICSDYDSEEYIAMLKNYLKKLPQPNYLTLEYLMKFLGSVVDNSEANMMTISNLAIVFGPTLLWVTDKVNI